MILSSLQITLTHGNLVGLLIIKSWVSIMGPLSGIRVVEVAGIGPAPFACMLLADMGAEVIRIDRATGGVAFGANPADLMNRGRQSIILNLKTTAGIDAAKKLINSADVVIEGFRPGVMEKLGLGPEVFTGSNPKLVYGRMTGWGQQGPLSQAAGHDINYIALTGALDAIGTDTSGPVPPLNLLGDFGGGSLYLVVGVLAALHAAKQSGEGQVVDAAIVDGTASLMSFLHSCRAVGFWSDERQSNMLDGGAYFYGVYRCADDLYVSIGSIEPQFYALLVEKMGLTDDQLPIDAQLDKARWPELKVILAEQFAKKTRAQWCEIMEGSDACFAPVLSAAEAVKHPHNVEREAYIERDGVVHSAPAPRFSKTPSQLAPAPVAIGQHTEEILSSLGFSGESIQAMIETGDAGAIQ